jgi:predicted nucleotidyltransferase
MAWAGMPGAAILPAMTTPLALPALAEEPVLRRLKAELARLYGPRLERVILFGSRARGDARPDSDWDIAVILKGYDGGPAEADRLADLGYDLMLETGAVLSLKPFTPEELEQRTLFMHNLRHEGVPV